MSTNIFDISVVLRGDCITERVVTLRGRVVSEARIFVHDCLRYSVNFFLDLPIASILEIRSDSLSF